MVLLDEYEIMMKWVSGVWILCFNEYITREFGEQLERSFYSLEERIETFIVVASLKTNCRNETFAGPRHPSTCGLKPCPVRIAFQGRRKARPVEAREDADERGTS